MTLWQTSLTYRVWVWLCNVYEDSALHRILAAVGRWCSEQIEDSRVLRPLCREGAGGPGVAGEPAVQASERSCQSPGNAAPRMVQGVEFNI